MYQVRTAVTKLKLKCGYRDFLRLFFSSNGKDKQTTAYSEIFIALHQFVLEFFTAVCLLSFSVFSSSEIVTGFVLLLVM